jgi:hypothetical protein
MINRPATPVRIQNVGAAAPTSGSNIGLLRLDGRHHTVFDCAAEEIDLARRGA